MATATMTRPPETWALDKLEKFKEGHAGLVKLGRDRLKAAYAWGLLIVDLHRYYEFAELGEEVGLSGAQISTYYKLADRYGSELVLLETADDMGTYDIAKLAGAANEDKVVVMVKVAHCNTCGSFDVGKEKMDKQTADEIRNALKAAHPES